MDKIWKIAGLVVGLVVVGPVFRAWCRQRIYFSRKEVMRE